MAVMRVAAFRGCGCATHFYFYYICGIGSLYSSFLKELANGSMQELNVLLFHSSSWIRSTFGQLI